MLATPPFVARSKMTLLRANRKPPVELTVEKLDVKVRVNIRYLKCVW